MTKIPSNRITQIQGLRALAAILVVLFHAKWIAGGFVGVDIFYVISGFLITGLLMREIENTGTINFKAFYARRFKRLLPASFFVLTITAAFSWLLIPGTMRSSLGRDIIAASLYVSNYLFAVWQTDYQNLNATPSPVIHFWSLAVEEQFYVIWPLLILVFFLIAKYLRKKVVLTCLVAAVTIFSFFLSIYLTETSPIWAFYSLPTRAWELGIGAMIALIPAAKTKKFIPLIGFILVITSAFVFNENTAFPGKNAALPVIGTVLLIATSRHWPPLLNDISNSRISQWLGEISYPLYLWHWPLLVLPSTYFARPLEVYERVIAIAITLLLADLTHQFVEEPFRLKNISSILVFKGTAIATVVSVLLGSAIILSNTDKIDVSGISGAVSLEQIKARPEIYNDGCHANYAQIKSGKCEYANINSNRVIVLYGDSHAAQWFPALVEIANRSGYKLISLTKSACPSVDTQRRDQGGFKMVRCVKWRENTIERIRKIQPDILIMSSFQYYAPPPQTTNRLQWWNDGQRKLLTEIRGSSTQLIYITDTPQVNIDIPSCLEKYSISKCDTSLPSQNLSIAGFKVVDPNPWLCSQVCSAVKDGVVAYRDASHISVDMSVALIPRLTQGLKDQGLDL